MGLVPPEPGFLELLRELATEHGALLVFDEVITGFRVSAGGAQELPASRPTSRSWARSSAAACPAAAYGGPVDLMNRIAPAGDVYQAGTLSGNPLAVAAGRATLALLDEDAYVRLAATTEALADGLREAAGDRPVQVAWAPGLLTVFFSEEPVRDYAGADGLRHRGLRRVVPRAARARRLPAAVAVRGVVPLAGPHARAYRRARSRRRPRRSRRSGERARGARGCAARGRRPARRRARRAGRRARPSWATARPPGPRAAGREADYALLVEAIVEGYLQHYGTGRVVRPDDPDLALLAGDRLYALGLARLAELGDLAAVAELADVISLAAQAHAEGDPERARAIWQAGAAAVGHGTVPELAAAKAAARAGEPDAAAALRAAMPAR